jgi:hypothetical protein
VSSFHTFAHIGSDIRNTRPLKSFFKKIKRQIKRQNKNRKNNSFSFFWEKSLSRFKKMGTIEKNVGG